MFASKIIYSVLDRRALQALIIGYIIEKEFDILNRQGWGDLCDYKDNHCEACQESPTRGDPILGLDDYSHIL